MILTITGDAGSGKSTVAKILADKLNAEIIYAGGIFRKIAKEHNMTLEQFLEYTKVHPEIHPKVDKRIKEDARKLSKLGKLVIVEGRVHFYFIPESIKIFLKVDLSEAAKRIWKDLNDQETSQSRNETQTNSLKETKKKILERNQLDRERYHQLYNIDIYDLKNFDLIVDTTSITPQQAAQKIINYIHETSGARNRKRLSS